MTNMIRSRLLATVASAALLASCSGGSSDKSTPTTPSPTVALSTSNSALDLTQASTASFTVTATRGGGFTGDVTVTVEGLPTGVTASALTITSANSSGVITLIAAGTAVVASANLTVRGNGSGVTSATAALALNVRAAVAGSAVVSFAPSNVVLAQGSTVNVTATITRSGGFTGAVTLSVLSAPAGVTIVITPVASSNQIVVVNTSSATIAITASAVAAIGTTPISISASGTGVATSTLSLATTVNAAAAANVTLTFCPASGIPVFVAYQDGTAGTWTRAMAGASNTYAVAITQGKGAIAYEFQNAINDYTLNVFYGSQSELQTQGAAICAGQTQTAKSVNGTVVGVTGSDNASVTLGTAQAQPSSFLSSFTLTNVPAGPLDLVASRTAVLVSGSTLVSVTPASVLIRRGVNVANGFTISPSIDLSPASAEAAAPVFRNVTLSGLNGDQASTLLLYSTAGGITAAQLFQEFPATTATTRLFATVPSSKQAAGDLHILGVFAAPSLATQPVMSRVVYMAFFAGADKTISLGPTPNAVTSSVLSAASPARFRAALSIQPEYNRFFVAGWSQAGGSPRSVNVQVTPAYAGSATTLNVDIPDLSAAGYTAILGLQAAATTTLFVNVAGCDAACGAFSPQFGEGTVFRIGARSLTAQ